MFKAFFALFRGYASRKSRFHFSIFTGARTGEISGLKWDCVDFENERIHLYTISCCMKNKSLQAGTGRVYGGVYYCRRTVNSNLRAEAMSSVEAGSIIGNSPAVNDKYYTFNTATLEERRRKLESVNRGMVVMDVSSEGNA